MTARTRVECFVDGFNLYHAVDNLRRPHLKWLDLRTLTKFFVDPQKQELKSVFYFSAFATWLPPQCARHRQYVEALKSCGTTPVMGQFKAKDKSCRSCGARWVGHEEKETDVNIALWLLNRAYKDEYDEAFIISRDSDLVPAVRMVLKEFPDKKIKIISPPKAGHSKEMGKLVGDKKLASIKEIHLERSLFAAQVVDPDTKLVIAHRPKQYDPSN